MQVFTEEQAEQFSFDVLDATKIVPEELVPRAPGRPHGARTAIRTTSSPRPSRSRSARRTSCPGIDFTNDPLLAGPHPLVRRHADHRGWAARTSTRSRSTRRSRRCTTTSATACTARRSTAAASPTSRTRSAAAARSRPARSGLHVVPASRSTTTRCAASRRSSPSTTRRRRCSANSQTPIEKAHIIARLPLRADARCRCRRSASAWSRCCATSSEELAAARGRRARHATLPEPLPQALATPPKPEVDDVAGAVAASRGPATAASARARSRSSSPTASDGEPIAADAAGAAATRARSAAWSGRASARSRPHGGESIDADASVENEPGVLFDGLAIPGGAKAAAALVADGRVLELREGPVPPRQDAADFGRGERAAGRVRHRRRGRRRSRPAGLPTYGSRVPAAFIAALAQHRHPQRETDPPRI